MTGNCAFGSERRAFTATIPPSASFIPIGDLDGGDFDSSSTGLSADGETVVGFGHTAAGKRAFVWKAARGLFDIGDGAIEALGSSADGSVVAGLGNPGGFRWNRDGVSRWLGAEARGEGVSANGLVTVGSSVGPDGVRHTYRWNGTGTERYTTYVAGHVAPSHAVAASADGNVFVGSTEAHTSGGVSYNPRAFLWNSNGGQQALGDLAGGRVESEALSVSGDGSVVVGWSHSANGPEAFRWTALDGMKPLGDLPGPGFASRALAVSPDGEIIVGMGVANGKNRAFIWDAQGGMRDLQQLLIQSGAQGIAGWTLSAATGVSVDGAGRIYLSGHGIDENGHKQAFHATLPKLPNLPPQA